MGWVRSVKSVKKTPPNRRAKRESPTGVCRREWLFFASQARPGLGKARKPTHGCDHQSSWQATKPIWLGRATEGLAWLVPLAQGKHRRLFSISKVPLLSASENESLSLH